MKNLISLLIVLVAFSVQTVAQIDIYKVPCETDVATLEDAPSGKLSMTDIGPALIYRKSDRFISDEIEHVYNECKKILDGLGLDIEDPDTESGMVIEDFGFGTDAVWALIASGNSHCYREWFLETESGIHTAVVLILDEKGIYFQAYKTRL